MVLVVHIAVFEAHVIHIVEHFAIFTIHINSSYAYRPPLYKLGFESKNYSEVQNKIIQWFQIWHIHISGWYHSLSPKVFPITMMTSKKEVAFDITGPLCGNLPDSDGFPSQRTCNAKIWCFLLQNKLSYKQPILRWFVVMTLLWRHCNYDAPIIHNEDFYHLLPEIYTDHTYLWLHRLTRNTPDNKVHGANMGPTWVLSAPYGADVDPMNLAIRDLFLTENVNFWFSHKCHYPFTVVLRGVNRCQVNRLIYMSPNIPANVFRRFFMVSWSPSPSRSRAMASTVPGDAGPWGRGAAWGGGWGMEVGGWARGGPLQWWR